MLNSSQSDYPERDAFVRKVHSEVYDLLYPYCLRLCKRYRYPQSLADDLIQDFYLKVLIGWEQYRNGYEKVGISYMYRIIRSCLTDRYRKEKSVQRLGDAFGQRMPEEADIHFYSIDACLEEVYAVLDRLLREEDANIMRLYIEGFAYDEIGEKIGMNPKTVGTRIHRAKEKLRGHLP